MGSPTFVKCCCCQKEMLFEKVVDVWFPGVYHEDEYLGDLCDTCAEQVGIRDSRPNEFPHNNRIDDYDMYLEIQKGK